MSKVKNISVFFFLFTTPLIAQFPNVLVSDSLQPQEISIAINPTNPQNLIVGSNLPYYYYTTNGAQSWTQKLLTPLVGAGDPCALFDVNGRAYISHISGAGGASHIALHRSSDGGISWFDQLPTPSNSPKFQDKPWLTCDISGSTYRNNIYMAWTEFDNYGSESPLDHSRILFARLNSGSNTWSPPLSVSDQEGNCADDDSTVMGAVPSVGANGEVYLAWAGPNGIMFDRSYDGGVTWGADIFVSTISGGWDFKIPGIYKSNGLPTTACDVSTSSYRGTVYILWSDQRNGVDNTDVFITKSTNLGTTWSAVKRVNTEAGTAHQFFPSIAIDQSSGNLYVVFYDRRAYSPSDSTTDVFLSKSTDGGESWADFKISQLSFLPRSSIFIGDYIHLAASDGKIYPIWTRMDTTKLSVWTALIDDNPTSIQNKRNAVPLDFWVDQNFPNPFNPSTTIRFALPVTCLVTIDILNILGQTVFTIADEQMMAGVHQRVWDSKDASGMYFYRVRAVPTESPLKQFLEVRRMLLLK